MAVENVTTISGLVENSPSGDDPIKEGDNHLTLIKRVLKRQFTGGKPAGSAQGLDAPVTVSATEFNYLLGVRSSIQGQIDFIASVINANNLVAPAGTVMIFAQANPPTGWTKVATQDGYMLVTTTGTNGGSYGGSADPKSFNWTHGHTGTVSDTTLTGAQMPSHSHHMFSNSVADGGTSDIDTDDFIAWRSSDGSFGDYRLKGLGAAATLGIVEYTGGGGSHTHTTSIENGGSTWTPKYVNVIRAMKS